MRETLPPHLEAYAQDVRDLLGLQLWDISMVMVDSIDDSENTAGQCQYQEPYQVARVLLRRGETDEQYRDHIMHELLHAALSHLDFMGMRIAEMLPEPQRDGALKILNDACERTVVGLTRALRKGLKPPKDGA